MKKQNILVSFNQSSFIHTIKRVVGYYYSDPVSLNNGLFKKSEDEYFKEMNGKLLHAKSKEEKEKISDEMSKGLLAYVNAPKSSVLTFGDSINSLDGYIVFKYDEVVEQFDLKILDFLSYKLNSINDYLLLFINYFDLFIDILDKEDLKGIQLNTAYKIRDISDLAKKYYDKATKEISKYQGLFKSFLDFCYELDTPVDISKLTLPQRFFLYNQLFHNPFKNISSNFTSTNILDYTYDNIPYNSDLVLPKDILEIKSIIQVMDKDGTDICNTYKFETNSIYTAFYIEFFDAIGMDNLYVKICKNCKKYFMTPKANIVYCDRTLKNEITCRSIGSMQSQKRKENEDYVYKKYRNECSRKSMLAKRNPDIPSYKEEYKKWKKDANDFKNDVKNGNKTPEEFEKWLDGKK